MNPIKISVDVQSGDFGPDVIIRGVLQARKLSTLPFTTYLCGEKEQISRVLSSMENEVQFDSSELVIEHCPGKIVPSDNRSRVWKTHLDTSIIRCITLQKEGVVQASVSAGDSGILIGAALFLLGRSEGCSRPALAALIPTAEKKPVLLLDVGANLLIRPEHLVSFANMGGEYMRSTFNRFSPSVALLNIGKEPVKGPRAVRDAARVLEKRNDGYAGFIEGNRVLSGDVDVVVCDGFAGNVLLKACESFYAFTATVLRDNPECLRQMARDIEVLNPENYGAVPFLGIKGTILKAHGGSSVTAIRNAVLTALNTLSSKRGKNSESQQEK